MSRWRHGATLPLAAVLVGAVIDAGAVQPVLDLRSVDEAVALGQTRVERERQRFHEPYRFVVSKAPIDAIDVVTPFRRVVLAAEERVRIGDRMFGQRQALEVLRGAGGQIDVRVEATFHPHNAYVGVPDYRVWLQRPGGGRVDPIRIDRYPRFGLRVDGAAHIGPPASTGPPQPLTGGTVVARFEVSAIDPRGVYDVVITEGSSELARARIDFARLR